MGEDSSFRIIVKIYRCLSKIPPAGTLNSLCTSNRTASVLQDAKFKLPKLELPKFDGDIINCREFWDQFQVAIHENETIAEIDKFTYLKSFLSNSALSPLSGLSLNSASYKQAIDILQQHRRNTQVLIKAHMTKFVQLLKIKSSCDVKGLRNMY